MNARRLAALIVTLALPATSPAQTLAGGFSAEQYDPTYAGDRFFAAPDASVLGEVRPSVRLTLDYAWRPLRVVDAQTGKTVANGLLVRDQFYLHFDVSLALFNRVVLDVTAPSLAVQTGDSPFAGWPAVPRARAADMRVGARLRLFGTARDRFALGLQADLWLPTGSRDDYTGDGGVRGHPRLIASGLVSERFVYSLAVGSMIRAHHDLGIATVGSSLTYSAGVGFLFFDEHLQLGPELFGATTFSGGSTPLEAMLGAKVCTHGFVFGAGFGGGLTHAPGAASLRAMASIEWTLNPCGAPDFDGDGIPDSQDACPQRKGVASADPTKNGCPPDRDGDGIYDEDDACPDVPGVADKDPKKNGCPPDRDGDGIIDSEDACPDVPGPKSADPKKNGCPDRDGDGIIDKDDACPDVPGVADKDPKKNGCPPDRDGDGIIDKDDACPDVPGIKSADPKKNGCPDRDGDGIIDSEDACPDLPGLPDKDPKKNGCPPDRDGDGVYDFEDACPDKPGPRSEDPKKNGCPAIAVLHKDSIVILQQVQFDYGKATIRPVSDGLLGQVAGILRDHPEIGTLAVEGHTDDRGPRPQNLTLSQKRAASVRDWLVKKGRIDPKRLTSEGFGPDKPVEANTTDAGRQKNRRVEFRIVGKESKEDPLSPLVP
jgi:outer membrane protein OmpA-like peptidoglycan-associated protein